jgi:hypothetical protein
MAAKKRGRKTSGKKIKGIDLTPAGNKSKLKRAKGRMQYKFMKVPDDLKDIVSPNSGGQAPVHAVKTARKKKAYMKKHGITNKRNVVIEHISGNKSDNSMSNLKVSTRAKNTANSNRARAKKKSKSSKK